MSVCPTARTCRCGSTTHLRVTHHSCPYNPKKMKSSGQKEEESDPGGSANLENVPPLRQEAEDIFPVLHKVKQQVKKAVKRTVDIDASSLPRISIESTSLTALKAEAKARGGIPPGYSRCSRETLLEELGVGTILLSGTREFRFVERVKALMDREKNVRERKTLDEDVRLRLEAEDAKHTIKLPQLHPCPLAPASALLASAYWDSAGRRADLCSQCYGPCNEYKSPALSCLRCGYDICADCLQNLVGGQAPKDNKNNHIASNRQVPTTKPTPAKKNSPITNKTKEERLFDIGSQLSPNGTFLNRDNFIDFTENFDSSNEEQLLLVIGQTPDHIKNLPKNAPARSKYFVWTTFGECGHWDGFQVKSNSILDSAWDSAHDANSRARFIFYARNPWNMGAVELMHDHQAQESSSCPPFEKTKIELIRLTVLPASRDQRWTVTVSPDSDFDALVDSLGGDESTHGNDPDDDLRLFYPLEV